MSVSTFGGLNLAFSGVRVSQRNLDITSNNIVNADTDGYTRQTTTVSGSYAKSGLYGDPLAAPNGVDLTGYQRIRDALTDRRYYDQAPKKGEAEAEQGYLSQVELFFNEPSTDGGVNAVINSFFNGFKEATDSPTSTGVRETILNRGGNLATIFNDAAAHLDNATAQVADELTVRLDEINDYTTKITNLSKEIKIAQANGGFPNDLLDQRDLLLDKLADMANISVTKHGDGTIDLTVGSFAAITGNVKTDAVASDLATGVTAGRYKGLLDLQNTIIPGQRAQLDAIAKGIIDQVNTQHAAGFDLNGAAGGAFFSGADAASMSMAIDNPDELALSSDGSGGSGANGLAISNLRDKTGVIGGASISGAYNRFITDLGNAVQSAKTQVAVATSLTNAVRDQRDSVSAVSLDEEMTNLIRFQTSYGASARAVSAMDEMLDKLVNGTGKAGL